MPQTTITSYYNNRKRAASDDVHYKSKVTHVEKNEENCPSRKTLLLKNYELSGEEVKKILPELKSQENTVFEKKVNSTIIAKNETPSNPEFTSSARKELSLKDIRKKIARSSRLTEIKASAVRLSKAIGQLKEAGAKKNLKEFNSIHVDDLSSPVNKSSLPNENLSPKKVAPVPKERPLISTRNIIDSHNKVPVYIRYASLAASTTTTSLPLPQHYRLLSEIFRSMETVVALLYNRNENITFAKLKPSVQEMLKRTFDEKHLAQIKHVVPDFYNFELQKIKNFSASSHKETYEMTITPNFPNHIRVMNSSVLLERRRYFYDTLLQITKKHHSQYLLTLNPPVIINADKLSRWHPSFDLDNLPEIETAKLPEMPNVEKITTAQDVLAKSRKLFNCNIEMERVLEKLKQAKARGLTKAENVVTGLNDSKFIVASTELNKPSTSNKTLLNPALRNLPASLLEKVKAKQAAKALEAMTRTSNEHQQKYEVYSRLPDLARTLRNIFVTERKNVLALNIILSKLETYFKANISASNLQRDITTLTKELPELVKLCKIRNNIYLKLKKNTDMNKITSKLEDLASKFKHE